MTATEPPETPDGAAPPATPAPATPIGAAPSLTSAAALTVDPVARPAGPAVRPSLPGPTRAERVALVFGVMLLCVNLRPAITELPPVFPQLQARLGLPPAQITLLAAVPVLCFGLFSPVAAAVGRRTGEERALAVALAAGAVGLLSRALLPGALLLPGTVLTGGAIAFMNVLLPGLIKRREPRHAGRLLSLYMVMLNGGAIASSAIVVPVYRSSHGSLPLTLGFCAVPMTAGLLAWLPQLRYGARVSGAPAAPRLPRGYVRGHGLAWQITAFMGLQSMTYYATLSFLPSLFLSRGLAASRSGLIGVLLAVGGTAAAFCVPLIAQRSASAARRVIVVTVVLCLTGILGALLAPVGVGVALMLPLGLGQGAALALALYFVMARSETPAVAASVSALAQGVGYLVASLGPLAVGFLHSLTGGWRAPIGLLLAVTLVELAVGLLAARPLRIPAP